jgi:WD40 repeat protein
MIWNATTGELNYPEFKAHEVTTFCLAWQHDGKRFATAGADLPLHIVKVWDARTGQREFAIERENALGAYHAVTFSPNGRYLVTGKTDGAVQVWDGQTGKLVRTLGTHKREIRAVIFSRDGKHLATASGGGELKLWDATRLTENQQARFTRPVRVPGASVNIAFSPDGKRLATGGDDNSVLIWDVEKGEQLVRPLRGHSKEVYAVAFSPDDKGRWIASGGEDGKVKIWDSQTGKLLRTFRGHTDLIFSVEFSPPDGRLLVSGSRDHTVKVWDLSKLEAEPNR